jgi:outer membrane protein assembly factor BamD (BamD/ComL family)
VLKAHIKENPAYFRRFEVIWTPTVLILSSDGKERWRIEGYLPKEEFHPQVEMGVARVALMRKRWADARQSYDRVIERFPNSEAAPEAVYWRGVCEYSLTKDHGALKANYERLTREYPESIWAKKTDAWKP